MEEDGKPWLVGPSADLEARWGSQSQREAIVPSDDRRSGLSVRVLGVLVGAVQRRDCNAFWSMLSTASQALAEGSAEEGGVSARQALCKDIETERIPQLTVRGPARARGADRAVVDVEADGDLEPLLLIFESGNWKVDLIGSWEETDGVS